MAAATSTSSLYPSPPQSIAALSNVIAVAVRPGGAETPPSPGSLQVPVAMAPVVDQLDQMAAALEQASLHVNVDPQQALFNGLSVQLWRSMVEHLRLWGIAVDNHRSRRPLWLPVESE